MSDTPNAKAGWLTYLLVGVLAIFVGGDLAAQLLGDKGDPGETISTLLHHLEAKRWYIRAALGIFLLDLTSHIVFSTNLIPFLF